MSYSDPEIAFQGVFSSGGPVTTSTNGETITIVNGAGNPVQAGSIAIECTTACGLSFDGTTNYHPFLAGDKFSFDKTAFSSIRVQNSGSTLRFWGLYN